MSTEFMIGSIFAFVGLMFVALSIFVWLHTYTFMQTAQVTTATGLLLSYRAGYKSGGYAAVFRFKTFDGRSVEVEENLRTNPPQFQVGELVDVLYNPEDPRQARINRWMNLYLVPLLFGGMGLIFCGIGFLMLLFQFLDIFG